VAATTLEVRQIVVVTAAQTDFHYKAHLLVGLIMANTSSSFLIARLECLLIFKGDEMKTFWIGIIISVAYMVGLLLTIYGLHLNRMESWNEFGDFLAGAFSPLAFLWLILGYLQQQKELQQNTRALEIQAEELKNSVQQYKEMVRVANEQLEADRMMASQQNELLELENKPDISFSAFSWLMSSGDVFTYNWPMNNHGREARNVNVKFTPPLGKWSEFKWKRVIDNEIRLPKIDVKKEDIPESLIVMVSFESIFKKKYIKVYELQADEGMRFKVISEDDL